MSYASHQDKTGFFNNVRTVLSPSGVVRFMSDPQLQGNRYSVTLDCGSAPVETFETLLGALVLVGANSVEIGQFEDVHEVAEVET